MVAPAVARYPGASTGWALLALLFMGTACFGVNARGRPVGIISPLRTLSSTSAPCANLGGPWEADWAICGNNQPFPGPKVVVSQKGCALNVSVPTVGDMTGVVGGSGKDITVSWSIVLSAPCAGKASGTAHTDLTAIFFPLTPDPSWTCQECGPDSPDQVLIFSR